MEPDTVLPGQDGALPQQLGTDGEGRAGSQDHLPHGAGPRVMVRFDSPEGVLHDLVHCLDHTVRRQAAVLAAQVHAAPGGYHADAQLLRRGELGAQQVSGPCREYVVVVKAGGAAVLHQFSEACEGAEADHFLIQSFPDLVQGGEPGEQLQILHLGQIPGEDLIEMVVGVHQTWVAPKMGAVHHSVGGLGQIGSHCPDDAALAVDVHVFQNSVSVVAGDHRFQIAQQQGSHGVTLLSYLSV